MSSIRATLGLSILAAFGALSSGASALPVDKSAPAVLHRNIEEARFVCDVFGRCVQTRPPVVRVIPPRVIVPGIGFGRPRYGRPEIGVRGGFDVERRREFDRRDRGGRGEFGDRDERRRPDEGNRRRRDEMQGDRGDQGGREGNRRRRDEMQGDRGDQGGRGRNPRRMQEGGGQGGREGDEQ